MKKYLLPFFFLAFYISTQAQTYIYTSSTGTSWPYDESEGENVQQANRYNLNNASDNTENYVTDPIAIPFDWYFYGNLVTEYRIYTSGYISFNTSNTTVYDDNTSLPPSTGPLNAIYAFWDDLGLVGGFMETNNYGEAPNRVHVIQWRSMRNPTASTQMCDFAIRLYECGGFDIVQNYSSGGFSGTVGCVNDNASDYTIVTSSPALSYNLNSMNTDDKVYTFYNTKQENYDATITDLNLDKNVPTGNVNLSGTFLNNGATSITSFDLNYSINSGSTVTETVSTSSIASGKTYTFTLSNATSFSTAGEIDTLRVWASNLNGSNKDAVNCNDVLETMVLTIRNTPSTKHVLVEEYTSTGCQKCPEGHALLDTLKEYYPNTSIVTFSAGDNLDAAFMPTWQSAFFFSGYPDAVIDRYYWEGRPRESINSYDDWDDYAVDCYDHFSPLAVSISGSYNDTTRQLEATVNADYSDYAMGDMRINLYLTEDSVIAEQANAFNNTVGSPWYGLGNPMPSYAHHHLMRDNLANDWGIEGVIPAYVNPGDKYSYTFNYTVPSSYDSKYLKLVAFVSENNGINHREVLNTNEATLASLEPTTVDTSASSIIGITIEVGITVVPVPVNTEATIALTLNKPASLALNLYNTAGALVKPIASAKTYNSGKNIIAFNASDIASGTYMLAVEAKGYKKTIKISVSH